MNEKKKVERGKRKGRVQLELQENEEERREIVDEIRGKKEWKEKRKSVLKIKRREQEVQVNDKNRVEREREGKEKRRRVGRIKKRKGERGK